MRSKIVWMIHCLGKICITRCVPSVLYVPVFSINAGPTNYHSVIGSKFVSLVAFYYRIKNVMISCTRLPPVFKIIKLGCQTISPGAPTIVGKAATERKQSFHFSRCVGGCRYVASAQSFRPSRLQMCMWASIPVQWWSWYCRHAGKAVLLGEGI